jgi:aryl-alcohol dehydrogenase-like predicted oxidoreductase
MGHDHNILADHCHREGKVKAIGISGVTADTIRRAAAVHPIAALQIEYSPFNLDIETNDVLKVCRELGITIVAYSPLGRGLLTGRYVSAMSTPLYYNTHVRAQKSPDDFDADDSRRNMPMFSEEHFPKILKLADVIKAVGEKHSASAGQVALAWLLAQDVIPIPGTRSVKVRCPL